MCRELLELLHEELVGGGGARSRPRAQHEVRENLAPCAQRPQLDAADLCAPATRSDALREQGGRPSSARGSTASVHMCTGRAGVLQAQLRTSRSAPPASPGWWRRGGGDAMAPAEKRPLAPYGFEALRLQASKVGGWGFFDSPSPGFLSTRKRIFGYKCFFSLCSLVFLVFACFLNVRLFSFTPFGGTTACAGAGKQTAEEKRAGSWMVVGPAPLRQGLPPAGHVRSRRLCGVLVARA